MQERDLPAVYRLEEASQYFPWPHWLFRHNLRRHASCWVLEKDGEILGFGIMVMDNGQAHIMNMCVDPAYRRRGLGRHILLQLLAIAKKFHARKVWLEVRARNRPACLLYRKLGFRPTSIRKAYYLTSHGRQNAIIMSRKL
jgi:ribosomal-protein-alanine N-acetyltransferase